jgi:hypothetical protein
MEYSTHQKERIATHLLEFYKDGKYAFDDELKRQSQTHYNKKSEIMKSLDKWCKTSDIVRWIIPILDFNLETDQESLENEWTKNHKMAIKVEDLENKNRYMEQHLEAEATKRADKMKESWISENEDVAILHGEIEELKNRKSETLRNHLRQLNQQSNENNRLQLAVSRMEDQLRETQVNNIEASLNEDKETPTLKKSVKKLEAINYKLEKDNLKLQKQKMDIDIKYLEIKTKTDSVIADLKTELEKMNLQVEYYKLKSSRVSPQQQSLQHPKVEQVVLNQE